MVEVILNTSNTARNVCLYIVLTTFSAHFLSFFPVRWEIKVSFASFQTFFSAFPEPDKGLFLLLWRGNKSSTRLEATLTDIVSQSLALSIISSSLAKSLGKIKPSNRNIIDQNSAPSVAVKGSSSIRDVHFNSESDKSVSDKSQC